jgi:hypothetical protein
VNILGIDGKSPKAGGSKLASRHLIDNEQKLQYIIQIDNIYT